MTNTRTLRLVTALVERYPEFKLIKHKWWYKDDSPPRYCPSCATILTARITPTGYRCAKCSAIHTWDEEFCFAPDLTDRANLAELFDVCAFLGYVRTSSYEEVTAQIRTPKEVFFVGRKTLVDALLAAAELALRLEPWEETTP